jgi:hypothetical protein
VWSGHSCPLAYSGTKPAGKPALSEPKGVPAPHNQLIFGEIQPERPQGNRELHFYFFAATMITRTTGRYSTEACSNRPAKTFEPEAASLPT